MTTLKQLINIFLSFLVLIANRVNSNRCRASRKQKFCVLNNNECRELGSSGPRQAAEGLPYPVLPGVP